jgi:hypothetical protein
MRNIIIGIGALAVIGFALPSASPTYAQDSTIVVKKGEGEREGMEHKKKITIVHKDRDRERDHKKVVIIKKKKDHDSY